MHLDSDGSEVFTSSEQRLGWTPVCSAATGQRGLFSLDVPVSWLDMVVNNS